MNTAPWEDMDITVRFATAEVFFSGTGETLPVVAYFDDDGEDWEPGTVPDGVEIVALTCGPSADGFFVTLDLRKFTPVTRLN